MTQLLSSDNLSPEFQYGTLQSGRKPTKYEGLCAGHCVDIIRESVMHTVKTQRQLVHHCVCPAVGSQLVASFVHQSCDSECSPDHV